MSSQRRIDSSRANGAKSRGPVTSAGRYNSSRNNLRHGLLTKSAVLEEERSEAFSQLLADLAREHNAQTETQLTLVEHMAMARWRIARLWAIERELLQSEFHKPEHIRLSPTSRVTRAFASLVERDGVFALLNRYEARLDRQYARSLNLLIKLADPNIPLSEFFHSNPVPQSDTAPTPPEPVSSAVENAGEIVPAAGGIGLPVCPTPVPHPGPSGIGLMAYGTPAPHAATSADGADSVGPGDAGRAEPEGVNHPPTASPRPYQRLHPDPQTFPDSRETCPPHDHAEHAWSLCAPANATTRFSLTPLQADDRIPSNYAIHIA
jgi:hypothetical protein